MTWTLRLYDSDDTEIAWITADPYDFAITHPDGPEEWRSLKNSISLKENGREMVSSEFDVDGWMNQQFDDHSETPKSHLEWVEENVAFADGVESTSLTDE